MADRKAPMLLASLNKVNVITRILAAAIMLLCFISGCSAIGLGIGIAADKATPNRSERKVSDWEAEFPDEKVIIVSKDSITSEGELKGISQMNQYYYSVAYEDHRIQIKHLTDFPRFGEIITVFDYKNRQTKYVFRGMDYQNILVGAIKEERNIEIAYIHFTKIIKEDGSAITSDTIRAVVENGGMPALSVFVIETKSGIVSIPGMDIAKIYSVNKKNKKMAGLVLGLALDITFYFYFLATFGSQFR